MQSLQSGLGYLQYLLDALTIQLDVIHEPQMVNPVASFLELVPSIHLLQYCTFVMGIMATTKSSGDTSGITVVHYFILKATAFLLLVGSTIAAPTDPYGPPRHEPSYSEKAQIITKIYTLQEAKPYQFGYGVKDEYAGTDFGQTEESDGNTVRGSYAVQLPDGRKQTVNYVADHYGGYQAEVTYYGEAQYPHEYGPPVTFKPNTYGESQSSYRPQPTYQPEPSYQPTTVYQSEPFYQPRTYYS
ncbi:adhesive plaque matrix protein-like [Macrobrachium rosenbergii]|uniref:adhesive plaque matrix protein-like n=1 Tax=Macrobrachium rosenbergii TaxID=79674 RepID=UPI0034D45AC7